MLDPITALSVVGNITQFIDFGLKATSKAREIYHSTDGVLEENIDLEVLIEHIASSANDLKTAETTQEPQMVTDSLDNLRKLCANTADEMLFTLNGLRVSGHKSRIKSARMALKAIWGRKRVEEMKIRLEGYRDQLQFQVLVELR